MIKSSLKKCAIQAFLSPHIPSQSFQSWILLILITLCSTQESQIYAQSDGLPRGAYEMPYHRYESETGNYGGGAIFYENPEFNENLIAAEASDQKYIGLPSNGAYVQWIVNHTAEGVTLRFTMPDGANGEGTRGALDIYINDNLIKTIDLTSYWAWQYFPNTEPQNNPSARPRMRFDEVHFLLDNVLSPGDVLKIQKNNGDSFEYGIDFIEIEKVPVPIEKPSGYFSVTDYGAIPNDGIDDLSAFHAALEAAGRTGTGVYIPSGQFTLAQKLEIKQNNIGVIGAGMWYTELYFSTEAIFSGGIFARCSNVEISNLYLNTVNDQRFLNGQYVTYKGFMGTYGTGSSIHDVWVTHFECGAWIAGYDAPYPIDVTQNLEFSHNRIRNNYADGINLCQGTSNTIVSQNNFRSNGDDAMAVWPNNALSAPIGVHNIFKYNTVENNYRAGGAAIFGGDRHEVHHCIIKDSHGGSGLRLTTDFPGYHFENTTQIKFYENTIIACGTSNDLWNTERGAIEINATNFPIQNVLFENIDIINAQRHGIQLGSNSALNVHFDNVSINGTGLDLETEATYTIPTDGAAIMVYGKQGKAVFNNLSMEAIEREPAILKTNEDFNLIINNTNIPLEGVSLSKEALTMVSGEAATISLNFNPSNASNKTVNWNSSNSDIATYDDINKEIVAHGIGTATITATSEEGNFTDSIVVNVEAVVTIEATINEASESGTPGVFTISTSQISQNITVPYIVEGTSTNSDYNTTPLLSGSVTLTPDNSSQIITINAIDDNKFENNETLQLILQPGSGYQLRNNTSATITILDNDTAPCIDSFIAYTNTAPIINQTIENTWSIAQVMEIKNATIGSLPNDYSGNGRVLYDANNLYVLVEVNDATKMNDSGTEWWNDDVVEIFIDGDNSKGTNYDGINDFQLGFRWNDPNINIGGHSVRNIQGINHTMYATNSGYTLKVAIPWSTIGVVPEQGNQIGLDIVIDDDDNGGDRDTQIASIATSSDGWRNTSVFGSFYLKTCESPTNQSPIANAGEDQQLPSDAITANLAGNGSDPDGDSITFEWSQISGPTVSLSNNTVSTPIISGLTAGNTYTFKLTISDGTLNNSDEVTITTTSSNGSLAPIGQTIWLKGNNGLYVSSENGTEPINCNREVIQGWEQFIVMDAGNGKIALQNNGLFISSENGTEPINCNRTEIDGWETFEWVTIQNGKVGFKGNNGLYISSQNGTIPMTCDAEPLSTYEAFEWGIIGNTSRSIDDNDDQFLLYPNPAKAGRFTIKVKKPSLVQILNHTGNIIHNAHVTDKLNIANLSSGLYFVKISSATKRVIKKLIVK